MNDDGRLKPNADETRQKNARFMTIPLIIVSAAFLHAMWLRYRQSKQEEKSTEDVEMAGSSAQDAPPPYAAQNGSKP